MRPILLTLALVPAAFASPALAQKSYDVDIVVFEHLDSRAAESERWRPEVTVPIISDATAFDASGPRGERLRELPDGFERLTAEEDGELSKAVQRLEDAEAYRVLRRARWRQPALDAEDAVALRFAAGEPTTVRIPAAAYPPPPEERAQAGSDRSQGADASSSGASTRTDNLGRAGDRTYTLDTPFGAGLLSAPQRDARVLPLDGTVKLVVSRYLHLHTDLFYTTTVEWQEEDADESGDRAPAATGLGGTTPMSRGPEGQTMLSYGLQQERRMRSGELHYVDHPVLGLLIKVTPHDPEA